MPHLVAGSAKPSQAEYGVGEKALAAFAQFPEFALQDLVQRGNRVVEVAKKVADATLERVRRNPVIAHCHRPDHLVQAHVEGMDFSVITLPRVVHRVGMAVLGAGAATQQQRRQQQGSKHPEMLRGSGCRQPPHCSFNSPWLSRAVTASIPLSCTCGMIWLR